MTSIVNFLIGLLSTILVVAVAIFLINRFTKGGVAALGRPQTGPPALTAVG